MKFKDIIELKKNLATVPNQKTIVSGKLIIEVKDGDIISEPEDKSEFPKKGVFALIEYLMKFTGVTREQANEIATEVVNGFKQHRYVEEKGQLSLF